VAGQNYTKYIETQAEHITPLTQILMAVKKYIAMRPIGKRGLDIMPQPL
jgi:hypothetical protein